MKSQRHEAIVLHTMPIRERDKLVVFLTPAHGKKRGWAYGARSLKSRFGAALEPLSRIRIGYSEKETEEVVRIESVDLIRSLFDAHRDFRRSAAATYLAELADTFAQQDEPSELLFRLLDTTSEALLSPAISPVAVIAYAEVWTMRVGGIFPSLRECIICRGTLEKPLRFDAAAGGFACSNCANPRAAVLPNDVTSTLESLLQQPVSRFAASRVDPAILLEIRSIARELRRAFLGHELRSHDLTL